MLGAGFQIALRDLEIRGAGNLLGSEQSGHIAAVGYEMYCQMLEKAVKELRDGKKQPLPEAMIDVGISGRISTAYIASDSRRLAMYQRLAGCEDQEGIAQVVRDLQSGYGQLPESACQLVVYHELKIAASEIGIGTMTIDDGDVVIRTKNLIELRGRFEGVQGTLRTVGTSSASEYSAVYFRPSQGINPTSLLSILHSHLVQTAVSSPQ
jgi:transcription-repair coupling factor (superfamily II helicase)